MDDLGTIMIGAAATCLVLLMFAARQARVASELEGWHPEKHATLLKLLSEITHELSASTERPGRDLDVAARATPR